MTENTPDAVKVAREAVAAFYDANDLKALCEVVLSGRLDNNANYPVRGAILGARAMQAAMAAPAGVRVKALDLATLLKHAFDSGAKGGAWVDYDCTNLAPYHRVAEACGVPAEYYAALEPAGAQEGAEDQPPSGAGLEDDIPPVEAMAIACGMLPPALNLHDAYAREKAAKDVHTEPTPAPAVPGLVVRLRQEAHETKISGPTWGDGSVMDEAADAIEALQAEVARKAGVIRAQDYDYGRACDERDEARSRATAAESERDKLKAEVERMRKADRACQWYWPENSTESENCADSPQEVVQNAYGWEEPRGDVVAVARGGVVEVTYCAALPPAPDSDSDDEFWVEEATEEAAASKITAELERRAALSPAKAGG